MPANPTNRLRAILASLRRYLLPFPSLGSIRHPLSENGHSLHLEGVSSSFQLTSSFLFSRIPVQRKKNNPPCRSTPRHPHWRCRNRHWLRGVGWKTATNYHVGITLVSPPTAAAGKIPLPSPAIDTPLRGEGVLIERPFFVYLRVSNGRPS